MTAIEITKDNFQSEVLDSELPVLLDLWAAWCGPCRLVAPVYSQTLQKLIGVENWIKHRPRKHYNIGVDTLAVAELGHQIFYRHFRKI